MLFVQKSFRVRVRAENRTQVPQPVGGLTDKPGSTQLSARPTLRWNELRSPAHRQCMIFEGFRSLSLESDFPLFTGSIFPPPSWGKDTRGGGSRTPRTTRAERARLLLALSSCL